MKKLFCLSLGALLLASCSESTDLKHVANSDTKPHYSRLRSVDDALSIADKVLAGQSVGSRAVLKKSSEAHVILADQSRGNAADTLLYAIDVENDGGFVLVAAPNSVEPIMAIIDHGSFADSSNHDNEAYQATLASIKDYVSAKSLGGGIIPDKPLPPIFQVYQYYDTVDINRINEPTVEVAWNQAWPENIYAPNRISGCVPVAIAQLLSVFEKPDRMTYTFTGRDISSETLNWKEIKKHKQSYEGYYDCTLCSANDATHKTIGRIIREIGEQAQAFYNPNDPITDVPSSIDLENVIYKYIGRRSDSKNGSLSTLFSKIDHNKGVAMVRFSRLDNKARGHMFIADGTKNITYQIIQYTLEGDEYVSNFIKNEVTNLIHYNWGLAGSCNGWFNLNAVDPANAEEYDYPYGNNTFDQKYDKDTITYLFYSLK